MKIAMSKSRQHWSLKTRRDEMSGQILTEEGMTLNILCFLGTFFLNGDSLLWVAVDLHAFQCATFSQEPSYKARPL